MNGYAIRAAEQLERRDTQSVMKHWQHVLKKKQYPDALTQQD